jgi:hypothetical protein
MKAGDFLLSRFDYYRVEFDWLGDLPADDLSRSDASQIVMALLAVLDLDADRPIGIVDQFLDRSFAAEGRPMLLPWQIGRFIALLIMGGRSGRISGICRRLFEPLDLRFQAPILFL